MKKEQFLRELRVRLSSLPYADQKRSLDYYSEIIADRMEDGLSEEAAVKKIGTPAAVATKILQDTPITTLARARMESGRSALSTTLIIIGSPIWISLLVALFSIVISALAVLVSVLAVFFSLIITLWALEASFAVGAVAGLIACPIALMYGEFIYSILFLGAALVLCALTILFYYCAIYGSKGLLLLCGCVLKLFGLVFRFIKFLLIRKEAIR